MERYDAEFFAEIAPGSLSSARAIVPIVLGLLGPRSVVDVGCGTGTWLSVFHELGVEDTLGVDGEYVDRNALSIPPGRFRAHDLEQPLSLDRTFDLAVSLEVAEHLAPRAARGFVDSLTRLAPAVLFSAAIPGQTGNGHVNEQWPEYWAELFATHEYEPVDCVRWRVWSDERVDFWYAQNTLLYLRDDALRAHPDLQTEAKPRRSLAVVHPRLLTMYVGLLRGVRPAPAAPRWRRILSAVRARLR